MKAFYTLITVVCLMFGLANSAQANIFNDSDLIAFYPFSGDWLDYSDNNRHGSPSGTTFTTDRDGNPGAAAFFNGRARIQIGGLRNYNWGNQFTVSVWLKRTGQTRNYQGVISNGYYTTGSWEIRFGRESGGQTLRGAIRHPTTGFGRNVALHQWHHVVMTFDGNRYKAYIDGVKIRDVGRSAGIARRNYNVTIGQAGAGSSGEYFYGAIDDVRLYSRALSDAEILTIYNGPSDSTLLEEGIIDENMMADLCID